MKMKLAIFLAFLDPFLSWIAWGWAIQIMFCWKGIWAAVAMAIFTLLPFVGWIGNAWLMFKTCSFNAGEFVISGFAIFMVAFVAVKITAAALLQYVQYRAENSTE